MSPTLDAKKNVVVLGAGIDMARSAPFPIHMISTGVIGLSTAIMLQERGGYDVTIIAEHLPTDPKSIDYCSAWAVCLVP